MNMTKEREKQLVEKTIGACREYAQHYKAETR